MRIQIDRDLPVALTTQVQGQIEYGVSTGDFPPGSQLPSVRELAEELGVSPVTISQVYRLLQEKGLVESLPGRGTFVASSPVTLASAETGSRWLERQIGDLFRTAAHLGLNRAELIHRVGQALANGRYRMPLRFVLVGVFPEVTRAYVADLRRHLASSDEMIATTFDDLQRDRDGRLLERADLVLTFAHRQAELARHCPRAEVAALNLIPAERTRIALAEIDPLARTALVSHIPEFLPTLRRSVARFAPHVESVDAYLWGAAETREAVSSADVVVYGTGSEAVLEGLPGFVRAIEFRHTPDPIHIERVLLPLISRLRATKGQAASNKEERT